jgi:hypothetical protein
MFKSVGIALEDIAVAPAFTTRLSHSAWARWSSGEWFTLS